MRNEHVERLRTGSDEIVQVRLDLSGEQLLALAHATEGFIRDRYAAAALDADAVLCLRALVALHDQSLGRVPEQHAGGALVLRVDQLGLLVHALRDWLARRDELGFLRAQETIDAPLVEDMVERLTDVHARALRVALDADAPSRSPGSNGDGRKCPDGR